MELTPETPAVPTTWRDRLAAAWTGLRAKVTTWWRAVDTDRTGIALAILMLLVALLVLTRTPGPKPAPQADAAALAQRVAELETRVNALSTEPAQPAPAQTPAQTPAPDPAPARPGAPRAALRPTPPPAPAAAQTGWGTTDLDREIAAFPSTHLEPAK